MEIQRFQSDVELLRPLAEKWRAECNGDTLGIDIDIDTHLKDLQRLMASPASELLVLVKGEDILGYMGLTIIDSPIGKQMMVNEHYWFVDPKKRRLSALKFLPVVERFARDAGCSHLLMNASTLASDLHDRTCRLYEKFGMKKFETTYIKKV